MSCGAVATTSDAIAYAQETATVNACARGHDPSDTAATRQAKKTAAGRMTERVPSDAPAPETSANDEPHASALRR